MMKTLNTLNMICSRRAASDRARSGRAWSRRAAWLGFALLALFSQADAALFERASADLQREARAAGLEGKRLAVFLTLPDCPNCLEMERTVYPNRALEQAFNRQFRGVRIDISDTAPLTTPSGKASSGADLAHALHAVATPSFAFFDKDGQVLYRYTGALDVAGLRGLAGYVAKAEYEKRPFALPRRASPGANAAGAAKPAAQAQSTEHQSHAGHAGHTDQQ